jgi:probable F420-dependent oxidoreductase
MREQRIGLSVPLDGVTLDEMPAVAQEAERLGYADAWSYEVDGTDAFSALAPIALASNLRLGTAIVNVFTRGPATIAQSAAGIAELAPGRFELGIGSGSHPIVESWNGGTFAKPATRVRDMVVFLRQALAGERVSFVGETFSVDGFRLSRPPAAPIPIHVGALRPGMLRVAGEHADGVIVNWLSAHDVKQSVQVVRQAAQSAGRDPSSVEITARLMVSIDPPGEEGDTFIRRTICGYLTVPVYRRFHQWLGRTSLEGMWDAWAGGDRRGATAAISDQTLHDLVLRGTWSEMRAQAQQYLEAGADTITFLMFTGAPDPTTRRARSLEAMRQLAPAAF